MAQPRMLLFLFVAVLAMPSRVAPQLGPAAQPVPVLDNVCHHAFAREAPAIKP